MVGRYAKRRPAALHVKPICFGESPGQCYDTVRQHRAGTVADRVKRRKDFRRQSPRFAQDRIDHVGRRRAEPRQRCETGKISDGVEHKALFGDRGCIGRACPLGLDSRYSPACPPDKRGAGCERAQRLSDSRLRIRQLPHRPSEFGGGTTRRHDDKTTRSVPAYARLPGSIM